MSDVSQGPGWWQAADGKWYSPEQVPGAAPPANPVPTDPTVAQPFTGGPPADQPMPGGAPAQAPFPGAVPYGAPQGGAPMGYPGGPPASKTNGMAVVSLILGIIWVAGIGSIVAVILGFMGRKKIEESQGRESGAGLAMAGIILGFIGIAGALAFWIVVVFVGVASVSVVNTLGAYSDGYSYAQSHYTAKGSESSVCSSSNVPTGENSSNWIDGCDAGWAFSADNGNFGNSGNSGNGGNTGNTGNSATTTTAGNSGNT